jgi:hypothetical protein
MSALGHKQTYAVQKGMSALLLITTAKADSRKVMSALPPKADIRSALADVRFGPKADSCSAANRVAIRAFAAVRHSGVACVLQAKFDHR